MAKKQSRRALSLNGEQYARLKAHCAPLAWNPELRAAGPKSSPERQAAVAKARADARDRFPGPPLRPVDPAVVLAERERAKPSINPQDKPRRVEGHPDARDVKRASAALLLILLRCNKIHQPGE